MLGEQETIEANESETKKFLQDIWNKLFTVMHTKYELGAPTYLSLCGYVNTRWRIQGGGALGAAAPRGI